MIQFNNIPSSCKEIFEQLLVQDQFVGFIYGVDLMSEEEALSYLLTIVLDFEEFIKENSESRFLLYCDSYVFWVRVTVIPAQGKFIFSRLFSYH